MIACLSIKDGVLTNLATFRKFSLLKRLAREVVAFTLEPAQIEGMRTLFQKFDPEQTGEISVKDFHAVLDSKMSADDVQRIFLSIDLDHTGQIHWHEFLAAALDMSTVDDAHLRLAFNHLDHQNKGFLTHEDVEAVLGNFGASGTDGAEVGAVFQGTGGRIDEETFVSICRSQNDIDKRRGSVIRSKSMRFGPGSSPPPKGSPGRSRSPPPLVSSSPPTPTLTKASS
jgi:Ca2+-binding EF-hand superfamily protein